MKISGRRNHIVNTEYLKWQNSVEGKEQQKKSEEYWLSIYNDEIPVLNISTDYPRPHIKSYESKKIDICIDKETQSKLYNIAKNNNLTMYMLLLACYTVLLSKYSRQEDIIIGSLAAGRPHEDLKNIDGMFVNTLAIRNYPVGSKNFVDFLNEVKNNCLNAFENQDYQFDDLVEKLNLKRDVSRNPLFDAMFFLENIDEAAAAVEDIMYEKYAFVSNAAKSDLVLTAIEDSGDLRFSLEYCTKLFKAETAERILKHFSSLLKDVANNYDKEIYKIDILPEEEKEIILNDFNDTYKKYPKEKTIVNLFEEQVEKTPDKAAVVYNELILAYKELNEQANCLARTLTNMGVKPGMIVGLIVEKSLKMMVGILAILKAGSAYMPIDINYPVDRINFMLEDCQAGLLIVQDHLPDGIICKAKVINIDDKNVFKNDITNLSLEYKPNDLAYIMYTSGSTGRPKGVMVEQQNVVRLVKNTNYIEFKENDRMMQTAALSFDASTFEIWGALLNGLELYLADRDTILNFKKLESYVKTNRITIMLLTTPYFNQISMENPNIFDSVKTLLVGGDALSPKHINNVKRKCKDITIINGYGPTENATFSTCFEINSYYEENIPIGKPISNSSAYIVDEYLNLVPIGVPGELCVSGDGLARGYLNRPELTAEKFVDNPFEPDKKMYRTGDLARWLPDGNVEFWGRIDNQVKIRGFRIELGEIEGKLMSHNAIKEAAALAKEDKTGNKYICAYIAVEEKLSTEEIRSFLIKELPEYMTPACFVQLEKLPLTANGKIDRKALPEPEFSLAISSLYEAAANKREERLVKIWTEVLGIDRIGTGDSFYELGGHSLKATAIAGKINKEMNTEIAVEDILRLSTVKALAEYMNDAQSSSLPPIEPIVKKEYYPAASVQRRMYIMEQLEEAGTTYNVPIPFIVEGRLDIPKMENAIKVLIQRHESLRTSFENTEEGIIQRIHENVEFRLEELDAQKDKIDEAVVSFTRRFDLGKAPLLRAGIARLSEDKYLLITDMHHIIYDGFSYGIFLREFEELYKGNSLPEIRVQYKDFAAWQEKYYYPAILGKQEQYWLNTLEGEIPVLNMPTDYLRPARQSFEGDKLYFNIDKTMTEKLRILARQTGTTMYMLLLSAWNILLAKYSGQEDILVGSPVAGRVNPETDNIIGMFVNTLIMRNYPQEEKTYREFLKGIRENCLRAYENEDYEYERLVEKLAIPVDLSRNPIFDTMVVMQNIEMSNIYMENLSVKQYEHRSKTAMFDMVLEAFEEEDQLKLNIQYCTRLYKSETIERIIGHLKNIIKAFVENTEIKLKDIEILSNAEKYQLLVEFNATAAEYEANKTIQDIFEEQADRLPDNIAVVYETKTLTYRELNERANQLARVLRSKGVGTGSKVAVMINRSEKLIIGLLTVLKAGATYLPIDPVYPEDRISYMLEDSGAMLLLIQENLKSKLEFRGDILCLNDQKLYEGDSSNLEPISDPESLAYIIYTSGSTGKPKGVMLAHRGIANLRETFKSSFGISERDRILQFASSSFDASIWEITMALMFGARLHIVSTEIINNYEGFVDFLAENEITVATLPPPYTANLSLERAKALRLLISAGSELSLELFDRWKEKLTLVNAYGPTETTICASMYQDKGQEVYKTVPIGKPITNTALYIVDKYNKLQPIGVPGELCVSGVGLAKGYLNRPELTAEKFAPSPFATGELMYRTGDLARWLPDGNVEFLGRIDSQVKIRGYRIEPEEIENQMMKIEGLKETAVIVKEDSNGEKYLCAYFVSSDILVQDIKKQLSKNLPDYMIPSFFVKVDRIPLTPNGKIDRKSLPEPNGTVDIETEYTAPTNSIENKLVLIWQELLGVNHFGTSHNFFELGGHSLKATLLISKLYKEFGVEIPLSKIFMMPTIRELGEYIANNEQSGYIAIEKVEKKNYYKLSSAQRRMYVQSKLEGSGVSYNIPLVIKIAGNINIEKLNAAFNKLIERHESLRTSFVLHEGIVVQKIEEKLKIDINIIEVSKERINENIKKCIKPFELEMAPLLRVNLLKIIDTKVEQEYYLIIDTHHIISDGISLSIFMRELTELYQNKKLKGLKIQYKDYAEWQRATRNSEAMKKKQGFWLEKFSGEIPLLNLPTDYPRPEIKSYEGGIESCSINSQLTYKLNKMARENNVSLYMLLLASYYTLLFKYTGQEDIVVGSASAGRSHDDLKNIIGVFINTIAFRNFPKANKTFLEFLRDVRENTLSTFENQDYQFDDLVDKLNLKRDLSRNPLFDTMFNMLNIGELVFNIEGSKLEQSFIELDITKFDLTMTVIEKAGVVNFQLEYCTKLFKAETIKRTLVHFVHVLQEIAINPDKKLSEIDIMDEKEKQQILYDFNDTYKDYLSNKTIVDQFEDQVEKNPDKIAIVYEDKKLSYEELNKRANCLARALIEKGLKSNDIVGIISEYSMETIVGILGILKAGGTYLPIDIDNPEERTRYIIRDSGIKILLTQGAMEVSYNVETLNLNDSLLYEFDSSNLTRTTKLSDLIYVIYASGIAVPTKSAGIMHSNLMNYVVWFTDKAKINSMDRTAILTSLAFDLSYTAFYSALFSGCEIHVIKREICLVPDRLLDYVSCNNITYVKLTPSLLNAITTTKFLNDDGKWESLRFIAIGGDSINVQDVKKIHSNRPDIEIMNHYGLTETTIGSIANLIDFNEVTDLIPIGKPIANTYAYILDNNSNLVPVGIPGELYISGDGVGRGYANNPDLTKEKIIDNPFVEGLKMYRAEDLARWLPDGKIEFLGRIDNQVKVNGFKVEIEEIKKQLENMKYIKEAAVITRKDTNKNNYLCAFIVTDEQMEMKEKITIDSIREALSKKLPYYMIPSYFAELKKLPLTSNGKLDHNALPEIDESIDSGVSFEEPSSPYEKILIEVWQKVLGKENIGINDDFFSSGGDSIKAIQMLTLLNQKGLRFKIRDIFENINIRDLAKVITNYENKVEIEEEITGEIGLSPAQKYFFSYHKTNPEHYHQHIILKCQKNIDIEGLKKSLEKIQEHHHALRTCFYINEDGVKQEVFDKNYPLSFKVITLNSVKNHEEIMEKEIISLQKSVNLSKGPMMHSVIFQTYESTFVYIQIHHLVVDVVSWGVLIDDLETLYNQYLAEKKLELQRKTTSFKRWINELNVYSNSDVFLEEKEYWKKIEETEYSRIPYDFSDYSNTAKDSQVCRFKLTDEETNILLLNTTSVYKVNMVDILLTALGSALSEWTNSKENVIMFEGHGREEILRNINVHSTVGWFASMYPLVIKVNECKNISDVIKDIVNQRNNVPNNGLGYGILKYLTSETHKNDIKWNCKPQICFNYHGKTELHLNSSYFEIVNGDYGSDISLESERYFDIQFIVEIKRGELICSAFYNSKAFSEKKITWFMNNYENKLKEIIRNCNFKTEKKENLIQRRVKNYMEEYNLPGIIVGIKSKDETPVIYTEGLSDIYWNVPMKSDTKFRIGSISKSFLATIVLQLVEEGILNLSDSIEKYIPDIVEKYPDAKLSGIILKKLLNHSSGLANNTQNKKFVNAIISNRERIWKPEELLDYALKNDEDFIVSDNRPWLYSNTNFLLAAYIIERVTKTSINDNLNNRIFNKIGLKNTILTDVYRDLSNVSKYNTVDNEQSIVSYNVSPNGAAGGLISDANDLLIWLETLREGKLLKNKERMFDYIDVSDYYGKGDIKMGMGIFLKNGSIGHDGFNDGCQTIFFGCKDTNVVIHTNKTVTWIWGQETEVYEMYADLISIL